MPTAVVVLLLPVSAGAPVAEAVAAINAVGREGAGNEAAAAGWKALVAAGPAAVVPALDGFAGASPTAANWLRSAVRVIADDERAAGRGLPTEPLKGFVRDTSKSPAARRLAFELLVDQDKAAADALLPGMLDDPDRDLRRDAVAARLAAVDSLPQDRRLPELRALFAASRDKDQVEELADRLSKLGEAADVTRHFGFVTDWQVAGPFDGGGGSGWDTAFPPEAGVDPAATYPGKGGTTVRWVPARSADKYGAVDLNAVLGKHKNATAYARAVLVADTPTPAEVRMSAANAVVIFLNGERLFAHEEYHHGNAMDEYVGRGTLKAGRNEILLKVSQNDQTQPWAQAWLFAARVCDPTGGKLPLRQEPIPSGAAK